MTSRTSTAVSPTVHAFVSGATVYATPVPTTMFTTSAPQLAVEKAQLSALFLAYEELRARVAAWSGRLAQERSFASLPTVEDPPITTTNDPNESRRASIPGVRRTRTHTTGETDRNESRICSGIQYVTRDSGSGRRDAFPKSEEDLELLASAHPSTNPSRPSTTSTTSVGSSRSRSNAAAHPPLSENGHSEIQRLLPTPTATSTWLDVEMDAFFHEHLAHAIQARETDLVNTIHACVQQELQLKDRRVEILEHQQNEFSKWKDHFQSKLDRRVAETNALRKEYYKQLLMLRELVVKQRNDPRTLKALEDMIATVVHATSDDSTTQLPTKPSAATWILPHAKKTESTSTGKVETGSVVSAVGSAFARKEKEKWEERAREAAAECQQLQEQVLVLKQQLEEARGLDGELWFATAQHGSYERQRILDSVYKSKCTWEQVGGSILELLNNEMVWEAVEDSAYREKTRVSRGLEALIRRTESLGMGRNIGPDTTRSPNDDEETDMVSDASKRVSARRRGSAFLEGSRMIMCRTCNGCGYLDASAMTSSNQAGAPDPDDDSYLRKTLAQVLELKTSLEEANNRTNQVEQQLLRTVMEGAHIKETLEKIEYARAHSVENGLQTDLDEEEEINIDDIMNTYNESSSPLQGNRGSKRSGGRWKQYEHLIVELKNLLSEREAGNAQLRTSAAEAQARLISLQKSSQQEQERLQRELQTLKSSLALAMSSRNEVIEEKQAAVDMLLKTMDRKKTQALSTKNFLLPRASQDVVVGDNDTASVESNNDDDFGKDDFDIDEEDEVKRSEFIAKRYSQAVGRVQQEHDEQQQCLKQTEDELGQDSDKKKRTNSIMLGNITVTMTSHPRDLFRALTNAHQELLDYRRSSQRSSVLQTDRLLTLTTHLAHISEELVMVKKRTSAEIEYWKLDCEKLQNANKALFADFEKAQKLIEEANDRVTQSANRRVGVCSVCEKHEARLLAISAQLLKESSTASERDSSTTTLPVNASDDVRSELNELEQQGLGAILLDLENLYSTLNSSKQQHARELITQALIGGPGRGGSAGEIASLATVHSDVPRGMGNVDVAVGGDGLNLSKRGSSVIEVAPSNRLFWSSFLIPGKADQQSHEEPFVVHGSALPTLPLSESDTHTHRRKKIVRKVLSEQEALNRQRLRFRQESFVTSNSTQYTHNSDMRTELEQSDAACRNSSQSPHDVFDCKEPVYSTYENGKQIFYVDIEEDDIDDSVCPGDRVQGSDPCLHYPRDQDEQTQRKPPSSRLDLSIPIPSPENRTGGPAWNTIDHHQSSDGSNAVDKDPEVIVKLRELVNHNTKAREALALTNWRILVGHYQTFRDQRRLDFMNDTWRTTLSSGKYQSVSNASTTTLPQAVRTTMQKLVQFRELVLDDAIRERDEQRKESRRAQAQLIHNVSTVLTNLSLKNRTRSPTQDSATFVHIDYHMPATSSPLGKYSSSRPVLPSTCVNLSEIPATQQVPTPSFPLAVDMDASTENGLVFPRKGLPTSVTVGARTGVREEVLWTPSIFENDNRFPQREVKFMPTGDGEELSLMHSTSPYHVLSPAYSQMKSPSKVGLSVDARRRPTQSAGPILIGSPHQLDSSLHFSPEKATYNSDIEVSSHRPIRPQSSPTRPFARYRPSSANAPHKETELAVEEIRYPERSRKRPSSSRR